MFCFISFSYFHLWVKDFVIFDLKIEFYASKDPRRRSYKNVWKPGISIEIDEITVVYIFMLQPVHDGI